MLRRRSLLFALLALSYPASVSAQTPSFWSFTACTGSVLGSCSLINIGLDYGTGPGGTSYFWLALQNQGFASSPTTATSVYNLVFGTGQAAADPGTEVDALVAPEATGGAALTDASPWSIFDSGDAIFISALNNFGVGNCVPGDPIDGFGQAGQTCSPDGFFRFSFFTPRAYDLRTFTLLNYEAVGLVDGLPADSCGFEPECTITTNVVPEPATVLLTGSGLLLVLAGAWKRRRRGIAEA
jgi:hypothetical protein